MKQPPEENRFSKLLPDYESNPLQTSRGGYTITMRECTGAEDVLLKLAEERKSDGKATGLHVGWGSFRNLDIAAARQSAAILLLDVNTNQFKIWEAVRKALVTASTPKAFIEALVPLLPEHPPLRRFTADIKGWLETDLDRPGSWLCHSTPERYSLIRNLFNDGRALTYCLDIRGANIPELDLFVEFRNSLLNGCKIYGLSPDTLYVTNLPWMMSQASGFFGEPHPENGNDSNHDGAAPLQRNLAIVAPLFAHVISASRLAPCSRPDNLRWKTERFSPEDWLRLNN